MKTSYLEPKFSYQVEGIIIICSINKI